MKIVKIVLLNDQDKILMQLRDEHVPSGGKWSLWGGGVEEGETFEQAIVREVKEEINFDLKEFTKIDELTDKKGNERVWFKGKIDKDLNDLTLNEGQDFAYFSYEETKGIPVTGNTIRILKKVFENK